MAIRSKISAAVVDGATSGLIDQAVAGLEQSWQEHKRADLAEFALPTEHPAALRVLVELVKVDQECRWQSGQPKRLEEYLAEWPQLGATRELQLELIEAECWTRAMFGAAPTAEEIRARFPDVCSQIDLAAIAADAAREGPGGKRTNGSEAAVETPAVTASDTPCPGASWLPLTVGQTFGRYEIRGILGSGGMGTVYRAYHPGLKCEVALKVPRFDPSTDPALAERFAREAPAAAKIRHANICPIYDAGQIEGVHYITMALIEGPSLADWVKGNELLMPDKAAEIVRKLAGALDAVHAAGIVHRDIKPSNVMLDQSREPLLMDFGLARQPHGENALVRTAGSSAEAPARLTHAGSFLGTPAYMSPEQASGEEVDPRSDIYSLGALFYELLTGSTPVQIDCSVGQVLESIRTVQPPAPRSVRPAVDPRLEAICLKALAKDPGQRYQSAGEMAAALDRYDDSRRTASASSIRRRRTWSVAIATGALFLLAGIVIYLKTGTGTVEIQVNEKDAVVAVDGNQIEVKASGAKITVAVGEHTVEVRKDGFEPYRGSFSIRWRGSEVAMNVTLPLPIPIKRWIKTDASGAICLSPDGAVLYAAYAEDENRSRIQVFNSSSGDLLRTIPFEDKHNHLGVAISPDGRYLFTTNFYQPYISRIDLRTDDTRTDVDIGGKPRAVWATGIGLAPDGKKLAVALGGDGRSEDLDNDQISVVDVAEGKFVLAGEVRLRDEPTGHCLAFSSDSKFVYVVTRRRKSPHPVLYEVTLTPPYRVTRSLPFPGGDLRGVAVSSKAQRAFVSDAGQRKIAVIDLRNFRQTASFELAGHSPGRLVIDSHGGLLTVIAPETRKVFFLDPADGSMLGSVSGLRESAQDVAFSPDHRVLFVAHQARAAGVAVIDLAPLVGRGIVFASNRGGESHQIYAMNENGERPVRLTQNQAADLCPRCSPDGSRIAFISNRDGLPKIFVMNRWGKSLSGLARTDPGKEGAYLDWSPDGREIAFVGNENRAIRVVDTRTGSVRTLIDGEIAPGYAHHIGVCWKRAGGDILVSSQSPANGYYQDMFFVNPDSAKVKQLTHEGGARRSLVPASSPDGKRIAFVRARGGETLRELIVMDSDGTGERCLHRSQDIDYSCLRWFPDGKRLLYSARVGNRFQLYIIGTDGGKPTQLTDGDWDDIDADVCDSLLSVPGP